MGDYNPAFKLHFYLLSVILILAFLNALYGFAQMILSGNTARKRALILQSVCAVAFLGLCILACFTAFWRDGNLQVSPLSAGLMAVFFILLGVTAGLMVGSFLLQKPGGVATGIPAAVAILITALMYVGELVLLNGHVYRFGSGALFDGLPGIVLSPVDLAIVLAAGGIVFVVMRAIAGKKT